MFDWNRYVHINTVAIYIGLNYGELWFICNRKPRKVLIREAV